MIKRISCLFAAICLLCGCGEIQGTSETDIEVNTLDGVYMEVCEDLSNRAATVRVSVDAYMSYSCDGLFQVQVERDGKWYELENEYAGDFSARRETFIRNRPQEIYCVWEHFYGALEQGHYRIVKEIYTGREPGKGDAYYLAAEFDIGPEQMTEQLWVRDEAPYVSISSSEERVVPYFHFTFAYAWDEEHGGWLNADGTYLGDELAELSNELPTVVYSDDFEVTYNRDASFYQLLIFDEDYERIEHEGGLEVLEELGPGKYYVGINVTVQGEYIFEGQDRERSGCVGAFILEKG